MAGPKGCALIGKVANVIKSIIGNNKLRLFRIILHGSKTAVMSRPMSLSY
jgi:hypothetical protein